ncbi:MAG: hypothetical protein IKM39_00645 [Clostridia bacterium]|nr:hypothetical protein [Clostridia bacterium]
MYEKTILNALINYHTYIQTENGSNDIGTNSNFINHIKSCEEYIQQGNEVTTLWMKENHSVVSKAVKYAHDFIHRNYIKSDDEYSSLEHKELNRCVSIFTDFYKKAGIDSNYMDIHF